MRYDWEHNPVLGIDLGTTYSAIACWNGRMPVSYEVDDGEKTLQSVVYYEPTATEGQKWIVGRTAWNRGKINPTHVATGFKRKMHDVSSGIILGGSKFSPIELSAQVLEKLYSDVRRKSGQSVQSRGTVVTVPYYFKEVSCENTKEAAEMANINFRELLQEPIAASLSYAFERVNPNPDSSGKQTILVFDLGGGTFDLTLFGLEYTPNNLNFEVLATEGHSRLGGIDFDKSLADFLLQKSGCSFDNVSQSRKNQLIAERKLEQAVVEAKRTLSYSEYSDIAIADLLLHQPLEMKIWRHDFEISIQSYLDKIKYILSKLWRKAQIQPTQVDRVILVGGSSRIPCIRQLLIEEIGSKEKIYEHSLPDLCVAQGAAIYAAYLEDIPVFGKRKVDICTHVPDANISILNQQIQELRQQVSSLERQVKFESDKRFELEQKLKQLGKGDFIDSLDVPSEYQILRDFLEAGEWKAADRETDSFLRQIFDRPNHLNVEDIKNLPIKELKIIDQLWLRYSKGRFGFSVQKGIWDRIKYSQNQELSTFEQFRETVGWSIDGEIQSYSNLTFDLSAPKGHLPVLGICRTSFRGRCGSDIADLMSRLEACNI